LSTFLTILYTVLIFGAIIFIHELGHFIAARAAGVKVNEFALGMGPAILKKQGKKTLYSLRIFPIGGYCAMEGEDEDSEDEDSFRNKSVWKRIVICAAGATMNLVLGFAIILGSLAGAQYYSSTTVAAFKELSISNESGLQAGDKIIKMNRTRIFSDQDIVFEAVRDADGVIDMTVLRDGKKVELPGVRFRVTGEGENYSIYLDFKVKAIEASPLSAISYAGARTLSLARNSWVSIGDLFTGKVGLMELSGPVGIGQVVGEAAKVGFTSLLSLAAFISISIGMFNLLPFPALDGGRIVFLLIEAIRRKPVNPKWEGYINMAGLLLLFGLMIVVTFKDVWNLF
jgi:regulator of sigma E protease